MQRANIYSNHH